MQRRAHVPMRFPRSETNAVIARQDTDNGADLPRTTRLRASRDAIDQTGDRGSWISIDRGTDEEFLT
jgi:hypothetical protein